MLASVVVIGGGRRLLKSWRARAAVDRLESTDVTAEEIAGAVDHGRAGLFSLFRLLGEAKTEALKTAAGRAIAVLWARDELIAEEEKALVRRSFRVDWKARKRYPRGLRSEVPVMVQYGVPFLTEGGPGVAPTNLEWSHRITGARRASLEEFSPWAPGDGKARFGLVPGDFETNGPHRLVFQARARTVGLTEFWEMELPHMPFSFEFDPLLEVTALLASPESTRAPEMARRARLAPPENGPGTTNFLPLNETFALRSPPEIAVDAPLPYDLAHGVALEFEGVEGRHPAGTVVLGGQGGTGEAAGTAHRFSLGKLEGLADGLIERPGLRRARAWLLPDPDRGWAEPDVRSIWPEPVVTDWVEVEVVRR